MLTGIAHLFLPEDHLAGPFSGDKIFWHCEDLHTLREGRVPPPVTIELDITNVCNLKCSYCTNTDYNENCLESLSSSVVTQVLDDMARLNAKAVTFTGGGEPFCHPRLGEFLNWAQSGGLDVALITNGTMMVEKDWISIPPLLMRCKWVRVSLDAHDRESYVKSKGLDSFDKAVGGIRLLADMKHDWEETTRFPGPTIGVGYLTFPTKENCHGMYKAAELVSKIGVDYLQFRPATFMPDDDRGAMKDYSTEEFLACLRDAKEYETDTFHILASMPKYEDLEETVRPYKHCFGVYFSCVVGATGDVWICCHMRGYPKYSLGNVKERRLFDIWNDVGLRNEVYKRIGDFSECMPLCRFHGTNKILSRLNWQPEHENFL